VAIYSIKDLEKLCGIKAHTIRIWEQRYGIVLPKRSKTNIRYYQDADLKRLLNVALLNRNGIKISKIAKMTPDEISGKVSAIAEINFEYGTQLDALTLSMIEMDELKFDRIVSANIRQLGFERTMLEVIHPFLDKLGVLWLTGSLKPVQENFMSYLIRQKIISAIDQEPFASGYHQPTFLLYLPERETQELNLLFMHYLLKARRFKVVYLGKNVSLLDLQDAYGICKPNYIFTMITETYSKRPVQNYVNELSNQFPETKILLSGYQVVAQNVPSTDSVSIFPNLTELVNFVDEIKGNRSNSATG